MPFTSQIEQTTRAGDHNFDAVAQGIEEAILNALAANGDMTGRDGNFVPALPREWLRATFGGTAASTP